jgi:hypothetical protein
MLAGPAHLQGELHLYSEKAWAPLPSTKVKRPRPNDPFAWSYTYTGFSLAFARAALEQLGSRPGSSVLDPFAGSGTTLVAAALRGGFTLGIDVSPFSALLSRARLAVSVDVDRVLAYLNAQPKPLSGDHDIGLLKPSDDAYSASVAEKICCAVRSNRKDVWDAILADENGQNDSEVVALLSLALGARDCARVLRGSNPIWYRRAQEAQRGEVMDLRAAARVWAKAVSRDLANMGPIARQGTRVLNADFPSAKLEGKFEFCLTSPPYLNRLD